MIRLTGLFLFSMMCLAPLTAECITNPEKETICDHGQVYCDSTGKCTDPGNCPSMHGKKILSLKNKKNTVYSLEEGGMVKCQNNQPLTPVSSGTETHWTCVTPSEK